MNWRRRKNKFKNKNKEIEERKANSARINQLKVIYNCNCIMRVQHHAVLWDPHSLWVFCLCRCWDRLYSMPAALIQITIYSHVDIWREKIAKQFSIFYLFECCVASICCLLLLSLSHGLWPIVIIPCESFDSIVCHFIPITVASSHMQCNRIDQFVLCKSKRHNCTYQEKEEQQQQHQQHRHQYHQQWQPWWPLLAINRMISVQNFNISHTVRDIKLAINQQREQNE